MKLNIKTKNVTINDSQKEIITKELGRLEKFLPEEADANVMIKERKNYTIVEMTIPMKRYTLRAEEEDKDLRAAVDKTRDVMERQIRKYKTRLQSRRRTEKKAKQNEKAMLRDVGYGFSPSDKDELTGMTMQDMQWYDAQEEEKENEIKIIRNKRFAIESMTPEEACLQMDLLAHDFFVFEEAESGSVCVVYRRSDGRYGIIEIDR